MIFSRKGFDSASGGCPSPILPDGRQISLPIPDGRSPVTYGDIRGVAPAVHDLVRDLTGGRHHRGSPAHLDPDLVHSHRPRRTGWRAAFGQTGAAQAHLANQGVGPGDLFLFFGLFRAVERGPDGRWRWRRYHPPRHVLWGWLCVAEVHAVDELTPEALPWALDHPHRAFGPDPRNTLYVAADEIGPLLPGVAGAGAFPTQREDRVLTAAHSEQPSLWALPPWCAPGQGRPTLTFHTDPQRWHHDGRHVLLRTVGRGQEFVLDCGDRRPRLAEWLDGLFHPAASA